MNVFLTILTNNIKILDGTLWYGLVGLVVISQRLDLMDLETFSKLNDSDIMQN